MLKLVQTAWGVFDLAPDDSAADDAAGAIETLVYAVLFTDAAAPADRVDVWDRRGWFDDPSAGTGLWYVRRQPLTAAARAEAANMIRQALLDKSDLFSDLTVEVMADAASSGNVSSVFVEIAGSHNGKKFAIKAPL